VSGEEILTIRNGLRKTEINATPPISNKNPIMKEFDDVFSQGYQQFFQKRKQQRTNIEIIISNSEEDLEKEVSIEAPIVNDTVVEDTVVENTEVVEENKEVEGDNKKEIVVE
jgi:hypothetical protein